MLNDLVKIEYASFLGATSIVKKLKHAHTVLQLVGASSGHVLTLAEVKGIHKWRHDFYMKQVLEYFDQIDAKEHSLLVDGKTVNRDGDYHSRISDTFLKVFGNTVFDFHFSFFPLNEEEEHTIMYKMTKDNGDKWSHYTTTYHYETRKKVSKTRSRIVDFSSPAKFDTWLKTNGINESDAEVVVLRNVVKCIQML